VRQGLATLLDDSCQGVTITLPVELVPGESVRQVG
jgi:hypothetical protein